MYKYSINRVLTKRHLFTPEEFVISNLFLMINSKDKYNSIVVIQLKETSANNERN